MKHLNLMTFIILMLQTMSAYAQMTDGGEEQNGEETLYLYTNSSSEAMVYSLDDIKCITFGDKGVQIWSTLWPTEYAYSTSPVLSLSKRKNEPDNINLAYYEANVITFDKENTTLVVKANSNPLVVKVFDLRGHILINKTFFSSVCNLSLTDVSSGIYIVMVVCGNRVFSQKKTK